jgi:hypothetical protein
MVVQAERLLNVYTVVVLIWPVVQDYQYLKPLSIEANLKIRVDVPCVLP